MNRQRWTSFPATTDDERALLGAIDGVSARRPVAAVGADGRERLLEATMSIEVAEPFDGKADVAVRLAFEGAGPGEGDSLAGDPWGLLDGFLRDAEAEARRKAAEVR